MNEPAVTPAPKPTTRTDVGSSAKIAGMWPSMRCTRMSLGSMDATTLPPTCRSRMPPPSSVTAAEKLRPSPA